jgi:hypothetical protein
MIKYLKNRNILKRTSKLSGLPVKEIDLEGAKTLDYYFSAWLNPSNQRLPNIDELKSVLPGKVRESLVLNTNNAMVEDWHHFSANESFQRYIDRKNLASMFRKNAEYFYQDTLTRNFLRGENYSSLQSHLELSRHL